MKNYDFTILSPYEFECFTRDILKSRDNLCFQNFATGRDGGIDLRTHSKSGGLVIAQAKRYKKYSDLKRVLASELEKVKKLSPERYIVATSVDLTPGNKDEILELFSSYIISDEDILGRQDLNALLEKNREIELSYFKLWLTSTDVLRSFLNKRILNNSAFELREVKETVRTYVMNPSFNVAMDILKKHRYVIISGEPGIGKTTLARMMVYVLLSKKDENYDQFYFIPNGIEDANEVFQEGVKQIFFFDDFLGNTRFFPEKNFDSKLISFIHAVQHSKDKYFILSTREYILNDAKNYYAKIEQNDLEIAKCVVDVSHYSKWVRGQILYNHLVDSGMPQMYLSAIIHNKGYMKIVEHKNYNPRIIESFVNQSLYETCEPTKYMLKILGFFDNPTSVWKDAYEHLPLMAREMLLVLATMSPIVLYNDWQTAYSYFYECQHGQNGYLDEKEWEENVRVLQNCFVLVKMGKNERYVLYNNPGIKDFLTDYIGQHESIQKRLLQSSYYIEQLYRIFQDEKVVFGDIKISGDLYPIVIESFQRCAKEYHSCSVYRNSKTKDDPSYASVNATLISSICDFQNAYKKLLSENQNVVEPFLTDNVLLDTKNIYYSLRVLKYCKKDYLQLTTEELFSFYKSETSSVYEVEEMAVALSGFFKEYESYGDCQEFEKKIEEAFLAELGSVDDPNVVEPIFERIQKTLPNWDGSYIKEVIDEKIGEYDAYIESMTEDYYHYQENDSIDNEDVMIDNLFATLE